MKRLITSILLIICSISFSQNANSLWKLSSKNSHSQSINKTDLPLKHLFDLDLNSLKNKLASSPKRSAFNVNSKTVISLPNSDGNLENFRVYENSLMAPELAAKYPEIKSYVAIGIDNPHARAYISYSPLGFKSMMLYPDQSAVFIEPVSSDLNTYTVYKKSDKEDSLDKFECSVIDYALGNIQKTANTKISYKGADDGKLRTFRLALSCTAEYAAYYGGTKALALAGMINTLTRINGVFEKDFGLNLILIANNDSVIYTNATTDPYSNYTSKSNWRAELKSNLNATVGLANYDIGHLLGAAPFGGGGDAGCIGCICSDFNKGSGYTCGNPNLFSGDAFDIDYVAHEMGHQLGANHTFTYVNDNAVSQMEPGSGSTIMSYAGSTNQNVQAHSDAYFHAISIQQVTDNIKTKSCSVLVSTGNAVPVVNAGLDYTIPKGTPFQLTGYATDANTGDVLTYNWEEMDLGNATTSKPNAIATAGPLFRSYPSSASATRYLPNMNTILAGSSTTSGLAIPVEILPGVARTLNFRLTVRDNKVGGSANNTDDMIITVDGNSGPFTIDSQNGTASYTAGTIQAISWTVAGTDANGVNCATVDILLSSDGGVTFPIILLAATPNTGSANVTIPNIPGITNRIMVKGTNQIFFDVNNTNFTIIGSSVTDNVAPTSSTISASGITTSGSNLSWTAATDNVGVIGYNIYQNGVLKTTTSTTSLTTSDLTASTAYTFYIKAKDSAGNLSAASNSVNVTTLALDTNALYCTSNGTSTTIEYINKVQIGTINNISGNNNGYGDFTSMSTDLIIGNTNTITITPAWSGLPVREAYCVWIDFNQDNDFDDSGEQVFIKSKTKATSVSGNFSIPTTALLGTTRIRVSMKYSAFPSSCGVFSKGEVEDYIVNIRSEATAKPESDIVITTTNKPNITIDSTKLSFNLYPNPVKGDVLNISNLKNPSNSIIFNIMGQELERNLIENGAVYVGSLKAGIYLIEVTDGVTKITKPFIKE